MYDDVSVGVSVISVPDCGRGKHLPIGPNAQNHDRSNDHYQICVMSTRRDQIKINGHITGHITKKFFKNKINVLEA